MTMPKRFLLLLSCILSAALFSACNKPVDLKLRLQPGDKRVVEVSNELTMMSDSGGGNGTETERYRIRLIYEVDSVDASGVAAVRITTGLPIQKGLFAGLPGDFDFLDGLDDFTITAKLAPDGSVSDVQGMDPVADKLANGIREMLNTKLHEGTGNLTPQEKVTLRKIGARLDRICDSMRDTMGNEAMERFLRGITAFHPDQPVRVGSTWSKSLLIGTMPTNMDATYTVTASAGGIMNVKVDRKVKSAPGSAMDLGFVTMRFDMAGTESGTMQVDEATGWVTASTFDVFKDGSIKVMGTSSPVKVRGKVYTTSYAE